MKIDTAPPASYALELKNLRKSFGKTEIIRGASLAVSPGERVALIGPNGAGKSTLFNLISGRFEPSSGDILLNGERINGKKPFEINRLGLSRSFQITNIFPKLSVFENLRCGVLWSLGYKYTFLKFLANLHDANARADELMAMIKLDKKRDVLATHLTYAEQRALEIGITIAGGASVILLDEPTAGMSRSETSRFISLIREVTVGKTLLTVEHDMGVVFGLADRIAVLVYGEVIAFDAPEAVRADPRVQEAYLGLPVADAQGPGTLTCRPHAATHQPSRLLRQKPCPARRLVRGAARRNRRPAGPQRLGPLDHGQGHHGAGRCPRLHPLEKRGNRRQEGLRDCAPGPGLRAGKPRHLPQTDRAPEPAARPEGRGPGLALVVRRHVHAVSRVCASASTPRPACCRAASSRCSRCAAR